MKTKIIEENTEQSLDELVVRARNDSFLKQLMHPKKKVKQEIFFALSNTICRWSKGCKCEEFLDREPIKDPNAFYADIITSLAFFNNKLYYTFHGGLFDAGNNSSVTEGPITHVYATEFTLYTVQLVNRKGAMVYEIQLRNKDLSVDMKAVMQGAVTCLCSFKHELYNAREHSLYSADSKVLGFKYAVNALCSHNNMLWVAQGKVIHGYDSDFNLRWRLERESDVKALCIYDDQLCDAGNYGINLTRQEKRLLNYSADAMVAVPKGKLE
jgi:hypothetical protein